MYTLTHTTCKSNSFSEAILFFLRISAEYYSIYMPDVVDSMYTHRKKLEYEPNENRKFNFVHLDFV